MRQKKNPKWKNGVVRWFDNRSGEGFIRVGEKSIYVHWSAIANHIENGPDDCFKSPKKLWCVLFKNQKVKVQIIEDSHFTQISAVK